MGFLKNHAITKSCRGLAKELLNHVAVHISKLPENQKSNTFDQLLLSGLKDFVDSFKNHPGVNLDFKSIKYTNWQELYQGILIKGVHADLSYDSKIGTAEHNKLIVDIGREVFDSRANALRNA